MSETVELGAARVRLIVDSVEMDAAIAQGKSAIAAFGSAAQSSYDRTEKSTRRAADALLDYVAALGNADTTMTKYVRSASRMGVEKPVLDAAIAAWQKHNDEVEIAAQAQADNEANIKRTQAAYKDLLTTQAAEEAQLKAIANAQAAARIQASQQQRASNAQQDFNSLVAPGLTESAQSAQSKRADAEAAFLPIIEAENAAYREQEALIITIGDARQAQVASTAQQDFNRLLGIPEQQRALQLAQARRDAEAAFLPVLEEEARLEQENSQLVGKQQAFLQELENIQSTAGKTYYELLELRAAQLGLSQSAGPQIAAIKATNQAMGAGTISAKQYEFALRGLPAQFTDIVVSLQAGQSPLTVLLQQGGQIRDMFGSVGSAVGAVGKKLLGIATNPVVLLAAALAAVAFAAYEASARVTDLAVATAKGNQVAGQAKDLNALVDRLSGVDKTSSGNAVAAVEQIAAAGKLTGDNFERAAQASAHWATVTGESVDDVAGKFSRLAHDPMAAVLDGTLKVTDAEYAQLAALDRTGDKIGEVTLAVKLYQSQINDNTDSVLKNLSDTEKAWIDVKSQITAAWHEVGNFVSESAKAGAVSFVRASNNLGGMLADATHRTGLETNDLTQGGDFQVPEADQPTPTIPTPAQTTAVAQAAAATSASTKLTEQQVEANSQLQKSWDELGTKAQLYAQAVQKLNANLKNASPGALAAKNITALANGAFGGAGYQKLLEGERLKIFGQGPDPTQQIKEWEKTALATFKAVGDAQTALYQNGVLSAEDYYGNLLGLAKADEVVQLQAIDLEIKALQGRANTEDKIAALRQQRSTVAQTYDASRIKLIQNETEAIEQRNLAYQNYVQALADANIQLSRQGDQAAQAVGTGSRQQSLDVAKANAIYQEALAERANNQKVGVQAGYTQADADKANEAAAAALSTQLTILQGNYDSLKAAEGDWLNGSKKAWADWSDTVSNQAAEVSKVMTQTMDGIADSISDAAVKGKLSFSSLIDSLIAEVVRFGAKIAEQKALQAVMNGWNGGSSASGDYGTNFSGWATALGSLLYSAKGNAFSATPSLAGHANTVVTRPTYFPFAKGGMPNIGLMGEKSGSPGEAIMPLTRTSGGELAVKAVGNGQVKNNNVYQTFVVPGATNRQTQDQIAQRSYGAASRAVRRNG